MLNAILELQKSVENYLTNRLMRFIMAIRVKTLTAFSKKIFGRENAWMLTHDSNDLPCYCHRFSVSDVIKTKALVKEYLLVAEKDAAIYKKELICFSITEEDEYKDLWLEVAAEEGLTVIETRSRHYGRYKCWLIFKHCKPVKG